MLQYLARWSFDRACKTFFISQGSVLENSIQDMKEWFFLFFFVTLNWWRSWDELSLKLRWLKMNHNTYPLIVWILSIFVNLEIFTKESDKHWRLIVPNLQNFWSMKPGLSSLWCGRLEVLPWKVWCFVAHPRCNWELQCVLFLHVWSCLVWLWKE